MWKLTIEDDQANKTVVHLVRDEYSVGRAEDNTVRLTERNISRRHARLLKRGERWVIQDNKSYNGCYVNGQRLGEAQELAHGDLIQLGDYRLEVHDEAELEAATQAAAPAGARAALLGQPDRLVMVVGPTVGAEYPLGEKTVVIGRGEECDVAVNHPSVSRVHAEVHSLGDGRYEIVDRESANGVRVNGVELPRTLLDARDVVELGDVILKFIPAGEIYVPGADESQQVSSLYSAELSPQAGALKPGLPTSLKVAIALGVVALAGVLAVAVGQRSPEPAAIQPLQEKPDPASLVLSEAKELLAGGDPEAALAKANELPEGSDLRRSADFRKIQAAWADAIFAKAAASEDASEKRALLDKIARATSVDSARRERAASEIASLDSESVDVSELPSAAPPLPAAGPRPGEPAPQPVARANEPKAAPTPAKPAVQATLVRKNPFDDSASEPPPPSGNAQDLATSGDRGKLVQAKSLLQIKAQNGQASERELKMLRALCRQLGDASCSN
jgi:pSer/pThr/pTyr-binding forkhead associated (FHA) protein